MLYISTRGGIDAIPFEDAVMMGLADDGGLLLPETIPALAVKEIDDLAFLPYPELAFRIISLFAEDVPRPILKDLIDRSYATFSHPEITPVVKKGDIYILELFHGPTLAFKDLALQFLGNLFEYLVEKRHGRMNILGATSGDTGSAAIYGLRGKKNINIFILHPHGKVSPIQQLQMTTVTDANVFNLAVRGTFDDGQRIVKEIFGDLDFKSRHSLASINSINWARLVAQIVYYFYAWGRVRRESSCREVVFSVPTGNFGDVFAGWLAKKMGLPIAKLVIATNENNILTRFVLHGDYSLEKVIETLSPSMDIQVASNFERYLYFIYHGDAARVRSTLEDFRKTGAISFAGDERRTIAEDFTSCSVDREETIATIRDFHRQNGYLLDPHTAVGVRAGTRTTAPGVPLICLATAHPAKFSAAVRRAVGLDPERPPSLRGIENRPERCHLIDAEAEKIKEFIAQNAL